MTTPRILTSYECTSLPFRGVDWAAIDDRTYGGDPGDPIGRGATEQEAIEDLLEQMESRAA